MWFAAAEYQQAQLRAAKEDYVPPNRRKVVKPRPWPRLGEILPAIRCRAQEVLVRQPC
jgi:hypothetical protein